MATEKKYILSKEVVEKKLRRMAFEILENNIDEKEIILAGIRESGSVVANVIQKMLSEISSIKTELITITLDKNEPTDVSLSKSIDFNGKVIILIDDVSNSGKTLLYGLKPFIEFHPKKIQTLVLVERTHTSFPVRPDYVGLSIATTLLEHIFVEVKGEEVTGAFLQ
jgi:pyrimidine operon attenuation protein / uracil phosphoribosyltransferase